MTTTVGGYQAVTVPNFTNTSGQDNAVCASRTYIWANAGGATGSNFGTGVTGAMTNTTTTGASGTMTNTTSSGSSSTSSAMGGNMIVTVYQTSGTCDLQAIQQFVTDFLGQMTVAGGAMGTGSSTGTSGSYTGTATTTP